MRNLWTVALFAAAALGAPFAAAQSDALPTGTYHYAMSANGSTIGLSTIVVQHHGSSVEVGESASLAGHALVTRRTLDATTFQTLKYAASAPGSPQSATLNLTATTALLHAGATNASISAPPDAPFFVNDNLVAGFAQLPAQLHATGSGKLTMACVCGGLVALPTIVVPVTATRPSDVPASDAGVAVEFGDQVMTLWYDPATYVLKRADLPSQGFTIELQSYDPAVQSLPLPPTPAPLPLPSPHYTSRDVTIVADDGVHLAGTLTMPFQYAETIGAYRLTPSVPGFVLVHGSGCNDRNETIGPNQIFAQIANHLSNEGYAVLRYDKRSCGKSGGTYPVRSRLIADARDVVEFLAGEPGINLERIYVLGHSEGGELVPSLATLSFWPPGCLDSCWTKLAGIVLMAPPAIPLDQILLQQYSRGLTGTAKIAAVRAEAAQIAQIESGAIDTPSARWLRSSFGIDPATVIARVPCPILILQGTKDIQVLATDLSRLVAAARAAHRNLTVDVLQGDDHLFLNVPGDAPSTGLEYFVPSYLDPKLFSSIDAWLTTH